MFFVAMFFCVLLGVSLTLISQTSISRIKEEGAFEILEQNRERLSRLGEITDEKFPEISYLTELMTGHRTLMPDADYILTELNNHFKKGDL